VWAVTGNQEHPQADALPVAPEPPAQHPLPAQPWTPPAQRQPPGQYPAPYPVPYAPYPMPAPLPPPRRTGLILGIVGGVLVVVLLICGAVVTGLRALAQTGPGAATRAASAYPASGASAQPAGPGDLMGVLQDQGQALLRGDEAGWMAAVNADDKGLVRRFRDLYTSLRAMGVSGWNPTASYPPQPATASRQKTQVSFGFCLAVPDCPKPEFVQHNAPLLAMDLTYELHAGRALVTGASRSTSYSEVTGVQPLESGPLTAVVGKRVVLAAPPALAGLARKLLARADRAALVADRYAKWHPAPARYTVYLAGRSEWRTWFGGPAKDLNAIGFATNTSKNSMDVVLDTTHIRDSEMELVMRHELGHVATLTGADDGGPDWLDEGLAEYIAYVGRPPSALERMGDIRRYLRSGKWSGRVDQSFPSDLVGGSAAYGMSYLAMRRLSDQFGEARMLRFAGLMIRDHLEADPAARQALGTSWAKANQSCVAYIRKMAG
jgi:hypothetical protein